MLKFGTTKTSVKIKQDTDDDDFSNYLYPEVKIKKEFSEEQHESKTLLSPQKTDEQSAEDEKLFQTKIKEVVHEGKKKFNCEICGTMFTIKQSAKQHILTVVRKFSEWASTEIIDYESTRLSKGWVMGSGQL